MAKKKRGGHLESERRGGQAAGAGAGAGAGGWGWLFVCWARPNMCDSKNNHEQIYRIHIQLDAICDPKCGRGCWAVAVELLRPALPAARKVYI